MSAAVAPTPWAAGRQPLLTAYGETIGQTGTGTFTQSGGTNVVGTGGLNLGYSSAASGTYNLQRRQPLGGI